MRTLVRWCVRAILHVVASMNDKTMGRLTITLDDELHRALKATAARQGQTIGAIIEESLRLRGVRAEEDARELVNRARAHAHLPENEALAIAVEETRAVRGS